MPETRKEEDLILLAKSGDEEAIEKILEQYKPMTKALAKKYFIRGTDYEDVLQEASIALFRSILSYDSAQGISFGAYAKLTAERAIIDQIRKAEAQKNLILTDAEPFDQEVDLESNYNTAFITDYEMNLLEDKLNRKLSDLEWQVLYERAQGFSYAEISRKFNISTKAVDNALQRIKKKILE